MNIIEAIKSGKPHKRKNDNFVFFVPQVGGIAYSQSDVMAEDWEIVEKAQPKDWSNVSDFNVFKLKKED